MFGTRKHSACLDTRKHLREGMSRAFDKVLSVSPLPGKRDDTARGQADKALAPSKVLG